MGHIKCLKYFIQINIKLIVGISRQGMDGVQR
jgi:hypothetical protein